MTTQQVIKKYGTPNVTGAGYLTVINLPYPMRLAWDTKTIVKRLSCHKLIADKLLNVFKELLAHYGLSEIQRLEIDLFGGCFNYRKMRGGNAWSMHAWGIAVDLNPTKNGLKTKFKDAQFSKPQYKKLHEIFEKYGFRNLGKTKDFDTMHWEIKE